MRPVKTAGRKIREFDLGRVSCVDARVFGKAEPHVKVSRKGKARLVHPRDLIQEDTGVDDLLEARVFSRTRFEDRATLDLSVMRSRRGHGLNWSRLEMSLHEPTHPHCCLSSVG